MTRPWIYPEREPVVCFLPGRTVACLRRGQAVLVGGERHLVTRIDVKRNRLKARGHGVTVRGFRRATRPTRSPACTVVHSLPGRSSAGNLSP